MCFLRSLLQGERGLELVDEDTFGLYTAGSSSSSSSSFPFPLLRCPGKKVAGCKIDPFTRAAVCRVFNTIQTTGLYAVRFEKRATT